MYRVLDVDVTDKDIDLPTEASAGAVGCDDANAGVAGAGQCRTEQGARTRPDARVGCEHRFLKWLNFFGLFSVFDKYFT